jgi:hypothetical protein
MLSKLLIGIFYAVSVASVILNVQSKRQLLVFLISFTFQTNTVFFVHSACGSRLPVRYRAYLQQLGVVWGICIAFVWNTMLGGQEEDSQERVLNHLLHYYQPALFLIDWLTSSQAIAWQADGLICLTTILSAMLIFAVGYFHLGYHVYPVFDWIETMGEATTTSLPGWIYVILVYLYAIELVIVGSVVGFFAGVLWVTNWINNRLDQYIPPEAFKSKKRT